MSQLVLVAEDEADIRELISAVLSDAGYEVITAGDGEEALRLAARRLPDICILDVMMPKVDGYDVTRVLKDRDDRDDMPIILLTARTSEEDEARGMWSGADIYLRKPFRAQELLVEINKLTGSPESPESPE